MFDRLQDRLQKTFKTLRGLGKIRESNIAEALADVRRSLLEADVGYRVVQSFVDSVRNRVLGAEVLQSVHPGQQFRKIIYDELVRILGGSAVSFPTSQKAPQVILLAGLQGCGKTTTAAKLAMYLRDHRGDRPLLVPADTARPAAREQLMQIGRDAGLSVWETSETDSLKIVRSALQAVRSQSVAATTLIVDTAGRLHVDENLMEELKSLVDETGADCILYVLDAMAGQDAVRSAQAFAEAVDFQGMIVTKLDGDARGGAVLSVHLSVEKPIFFVGTGEKVEALEPLHPQRMASRILGMGDIVSFVEKAQKAVDFEQVQRLSQKIRKNQFTIEDFGDQLASLRKMGSLENLIGLLPGGNQIKKALAGGMPEREITKVDAIIKSMTPRERTNHQVLNGSRRKRIAQGSGTTVADVNRFLKQFLQARTLMSRLGKQEFPMGPGGFPPLA